MRSAASSTSTPPPNGSPAAPTASLGRPVDEVVSWWTEAVADDQPLGEGQPAIVKVEPGPRYFEVKVTAVRDTQAAVRRLAGDRARHLEPPPQRGRALRVRAARAGTAEVREPDGAGRRRRPRLQQPARPAFSATPSCWPSRRRPSRPSGARPRPSCIGAQRAADLVSKMLAYAGGGRVVAERVDLDALVREMVDLLEASVARDCTLTLHEPGAAAAGRDRPHADPAGRAQPDRQCHRSRGRGRAWSRSRPARSCSIAMR